MQKNRFFDPNVDKFYIKRQKVEKHHIKKSIDIPHFSGLTPLNYGIHCSKIDLAEQLLELGADPNLSDLRGTPPIVFAAQCDNTKIADLLIQYGVDINSTDDNGRTAAHFAYFRGNLELAALLASHGADHNVVDRDGRNVLDYAGSQSEHKDVKTLINIAKYAGAKSMEVHQKSPRPSHCNEYYRRLETYKSMIPNKFTYRKFLGVFEILSFLFISIGFYEYWFSNRYEIPWLLDFLFWIYYIIFISIFALTTDLFGLLREEFHSHEKKDRKIEYSKLNTQFDSAKIGNILRYVSEDFFRRLVNRKKITRNINLYDFTISIISPFVFVPILYTIFYNWHSAFVFANINNSEPLFFVFSVMLLAFSIIWVSALIYMSKSILMVRVLENSIISNQNLVAAKIGKKFLEPKISVPGSETILYLRSFQHDQRFSIGNFDFEALIVYLLDEIYPVVSLSYDQNRIGPASVESDDTVWIDRVTTLAKYARLIVMLPALSRGVLWEVNFLHKKRLLNKTVFVAPPEKGNLGFSHEWERMRAHPELQKFEIPPYCESGFLFSLDAKGRLKSFGPLGVDPPLEIEAESKKTKKKFRPDDDWDEGDTDEDGGNGGPNSQTSDGGPQSGNVSIGSQAATFVALAQTTLAMNQMMQSVPQLTPSQIDQLQTDASAGGSDGGGDGDGGGWGDGGGSG